MAKEHREMIKKTKPWQFVTAEGRRRMGDKNRGRKLSKVTRAKMSRAKKRQWENGTMNGAREAIIARNKKPFILTGRMGDL